MDPHPMNKNNSKTITYQLKAAQNAASIKVQQSDKYLKANRK